MEDLEQKTVLEFNRSLTPDEVKEMLNDLSKKIYSFRIVQTGFFNTGVEEGRCKTEDYINNLSGSVTNRGDYTQVGISFQLAHESDGYPRFKRVRFPTTSGYEWEEISEQERKLIERLRKDIGHYLVSK